MRLLPFILSLVCVFVFTSTPALALEQLPTTVDGIRIDQSPIACTQEYQSYFDVHKKRKVWRLIGRYSVNALLAGASIAGGIALVGAEVYFILVTVVLGLMPPALSWSLGDAIADWIDRGPEYQMAYEAQLLSQISEKELKDQAHRVAVKAIVEKENKRRSQLGLEPLSADEMARIEKHTPHGKYPYNILSHLTKKIGNGKSYEEVRQVLLALTKTKKFCPRQNADSKPKLATYRKLKRALKHSLK